MGLDLRLRTADSADGAEGDQFPHLQIQSTAGIGIAKAEFGKIVGDMLLVSRRIFMQGGNVFCAENIALHLKAVLKTGRFGHGCLVGQRQPDALLGKDFVADL